MAVAVALRCWTITAGGGGGALGTIDGRGSRLSDADGGLSVVVVLAPSEALSAGVTPGRSEELLLVLLVLLWAPLLASLPPA